MKPTNDKHGFAAATATFEDGVARVCRLYGVNPLLGRLFAVLFVSTEPTSLDDLCRRVDAAKSTVSVALRRLESLRVVRRVPHRADRRDFYEAVTDPWVVLSDWSRMFLMPELEMWRETGVVVDRALGSAKDAPRGEANRELRARLARMREFADLFEQLLGDVERVRPSVGPARAIAIVVEDATKGRR